MVETGARMRQMSGHRALLAAIVAAAVMTLGPAAPAGAQTTHKFLEYWDTPAGSEPEPEAVDNNGDVYVYNGGDNTVSKYDAYGNPVNFSGLGTNTIDGSGGPNCPAVEADCDRVPSGDISGALYGSTAKRVAVDDSNGPASGDIYVLNRQGGPINEFWEEPVGAVEVFGPDGRYKGELDESRTFPRNAVNGFNYNNKNEIVVDRNGHIYVAGSGQIDQYLPVDGVPEHDEFIGQLRGQIEGMAAGPTYTVVRGRYWYQYKPSAYEIQVDPQPFNRSSKGCPTEFTGTEYVPPCGELWEDGGIDSAGNDVFRNVEIDPRNEDVYLTNHGNFEQWDKESTHQIGPHFGSPQAAGEGLAFDVTGGPTDGRIYTRGGHNSYNSIAVFSPPVHVPDVSYEAADEGHTSFTVHSHVSLDGGPEVTSCRVEYGFKRFLETGFVPCDQATPYAGDQSVTATIGGLQTQKTYFYRVRVVTSNGTIYGATQETHTVAVLSLATDPATEITPTSAAINGHLDPDGMETEYHYEYGLTSDYDLSTPEVMIPGGSGVQSTEPAPLTNLQPGRKYHYALFATNSLGTTQGNDMTFVASGSPLITGVRTTDVAETGADLHARINPLGVDTTYRFEYGINPNYGSSVPIPEGEVPASDAPEEVVTHLSGLEPGFIYHFRAVATNKWGTTYGNDTTIQYFPPSCPNSHVRQLTSANELPDCRAYELVSPPEAAGVSLFPGTMTVDPHFGEPFGLATPNSPYRPVSSNRGYASSPSHLAFWGALGVLQGTDAPNTLIDMYVATRTNTGWKTVYPGVPGKESSGSVLPYCSDSMELCLSYEYPGFFHIGPIENTPWVWSTKSSSDFLEKWPTNYRAVPGSDKFVGDRVPSGDFSQFIFSSRELAFAIGGRESAPGSAYDNDIASKSVTVISKLPSGADIEQERPAPNEFIRVKAVSPNGSHVLLTTTSLEGPENAYLRVNGAITYTIGTGVKVIGMSRNGDKVIVESNNELTPEDTDTSSDLYMWQESTQSLKLLSVSGSAGNTDDCNTTWTGKCGAVVPTTERKDTDSRLALQTGDVVFYSPESLDPTKPGVPNQRNVYLTHDGGIDLIATLDPGTTIDRLQISPDGEHVAFLTRASLTGYDNTSCEYEVPTESRGFEESHVCKPMEEMYEYDANRPSLTCVSCMRDGTPPTNDVLASAGGLFMSDDGRTFFTTSDPLVPADTDRIFDVYEYVDGRPQLISAGNGVGDFFSGGLFYPPQRTGLEGVSHDGVDVYFSTYDTLVPQDHNGHFVKFYDARENGGFPLDAGVLPCKAADECHGPGSEPSEEPQVSTNTGLGAAGNVAAKKQKKSGSGRRARHRRRQRHHRRAARHAKGPRHG